jgi:hypothetical protein
MQFAFHPIGLRGSCDAPSCVIPRSAGAPTQDTALRQGASGLRGVCGLYGGLNGLLHGPQKPFAGDDSAKPHSSWGGIGMLRLTGFLCSQFTH